MKPVRLFTRIADFRWLARASRTVNVQWMGNLGVPLRWMKGRFPKALSCI
jgi:hypothetical protein